MISGSFDVLDFFLFCIAALLSPPVIIAQTKIQNSDDVQGRRFGGYRIVPKACNSTNDDTLPSGVCMFNNDCTRMNGTAGGSCTDGFLFGTCCILTEGSYYISVPLSLNPAATTSGGLVIPQTVSTTPKAHVPSNLGDTVLFHKDGTLVHGSYKPVDFLFNKRPDLFLTNETYEEPFGEQFVPERVSTVKPTTMVWHTTKDYTKPYTYNSIKDMVKSTTNFRTSTISKYPFTDNRKSTTEPSYFYTSDNNYNLVSNTQTDYQKIKDSTNQESIYHILNILNNSAPDHLSTPSKNGYITLPSTTPDSIYSVQNKNSPGTNYPKDSTVQSASTYLVTKKQTLVSIKPIHAPCKSSANLNKYGILTSSNDPNCPPGSVSSSTDDIIKGQSNFYNKFKPQFSTTTKVPHEPNKVISSVYSNLHNQNSGNIHKFTTSKPNTHYVNYLTVSSNPYKPTKRPQPGSLHTSINTTQYVHLTGIHVTPDANVTPKPGSNHVFEPIPTVILLETPNTTPVVKTSKRPSTVKTPTNSIISINSNPNIATFRPTSTTYNLGNKTPTSLITSVAPIGISTNSHNSHVRPVSENLGSIYSVASAVKPHPKPEDTITVTSVPLFEPVNPQLTVPTQTLQLTKNSTEILVAFPPNRDPSANISHLRPDPEIVSWISAKPDDTVDLGENSYNDLIEDATFDTKVHTFVEKIVQNLQGNFVDLENVLIDGSTGSNFTNTPTKKPNKTPSKKPSKKPSTSAVTNATKPLITRPPPRPESVTVPVKTTLTNTTSKPSLKPTIVEVSSHLDAELETESINKACGIRPLMKNGRIVGGKGATFGEWPWQVLVREATWLGLFTKNKCGGVLLTNKYVITAAHCQPGFLASLIAVFGEYDISGEIESRRSVSRNVRRVIVHRYYNAATFENDVSLLELESAIQFDKHIIPICMPKDSDDYTGMIATVTGWGRLKYGGGVPSVLQEVHVPVIDNNVCQEMFHTAGHSKTILNSFICAGYANGQRDSCEGDSGGPLMVEREDGHWVLAGTVSHGIKCAAPYLPGVYMRTTYYKPWIQTITGVKDL